LTQVSKEYGIKKIDPFKASSHMLLSEPDVACVCVSYDTTKYPPKGFPSCLNNEMQCNADRCFFHREKGAEGKAFGWAEAEPGSFLPLPPLPALPRPHGSQARGHQRLDVPIRLQCQGDKHMGTGRKSNSSMIWVCMCSTAATVSVQKTGGCHGEEKEMCFTGHHGRWLVSL